MNFKAMLSQQVNLSALVVGVFLIVGITKLTAFLPEQYYFSFSGFLLNVGGSVHWSSLIIKLVIPCAAGFAIGFAWKDAGVTTAASVGFLSAFILCWPAILLWDRIIADEMYEKRNVFLLIYALYMVTFSYLCLVGAKVGLAGRSAITAHTGPSEAASGAFDWKGITKDIVVAGFTTVLSVVLSNAFAK